MTATGRRCSQRPKTAADLDTVINTNPSGPRALKPGDCQRQCSRGLEYDHLRDPCAGVHTISPTRPCLDHDPVVIAGYTSPRQPNTLANGNNAVLLIEPSMDERGVVRYGSTITAVV